MQDFLTGPDCRTCSITYLEHALNAATAGLAFIRLPVVFAQTPERPGLPVRDNCPAGDVRSKNRFQEDKLDLVRAAAPLRKAAPSPDESPNAQSGRITFIYFYG